MLPFHIASGLSSNPRTVPRGSNIMDTSSVNGDPRSLPSNGSGSFLNPTLATGPPTTVPMSTTADGPEPSTSDNVKSLLGSAVGLLDDTQKDRVLSAPDSVLSFASFHPFAATGRQADPDFKLSPRTQLDNAKRVVIETLANGETYWRWVPKARGVASSGNEGQFPRVVLISGHPYRMSQEQWDIYKLDPSYDCYVPPDGAPPIISLNNTTKDEASMGTFSDSSQTTQSTQASFSSFDSSKRSFSRSDSEDTPVHPTKKPRPAFVNSDVDEEDEVADIVEEVHAGPSFHDRVRGRRAEMEKKRRERREKLPSSRHFSHSLSEGLEDGVYDLSMEDAEGWPTADSYKHTMEPDETLDGRRLKVPRTYHEFRTTTTTYRVRTRVARKKTVAQSYKEREAMARAARDEKEWAQFTAFSYPFGSTSKTTDESAQPSSSQRSYERHQSFAEPSKQRPRSSDSTRVEVDEELLAKKKRMEEMNRMEAAEAQRRQKAAAERKRAEAEKIKNDRRSKRENPSWRYGAWSHDRAFESYKMISSFFDAEKFTEEYPVTFEDVPWPVLLQPGTYDHTEITTVAILDFFARHKTLRLGQGYKALVQTTQRRFHPDRWDSRRLWKGLDSTVEDELRTAVDTVSKTMGSLLNQLKERS